MMPRLMNNLHTVSSPDPSSAGAYTTSDKALSGRVWLHETNPLPCKMFIACSINARAPDGLVEVTYLTKATGFWWVICSFEVLKMLENSDLFA